MAEGETRKRLETPLGVPPGLPGKSWRGFRVIAMGATEPHGRSSPGETLRNVGGCRQ
jgi:hypothetical protein